jgi:hypothetical protein
MTTPRAIDEAANVLLATNKDGAAVHAPAALRAGLTKLALMLAQRGVALPEDVVAVVGEVAAEAGVVESQPASQMYARLELHLEQALPPQVPQMIERAFVEADAHGPDPILRFAAVLEGIVAAARAPAQKKKKDERTAKGGVLVRAILNEKKKKPAKPKKK